MEFKAARFSGLYAVWITDTQGQEHHYPAVEVEKDGAGNLTLRTETGVERWLSTQWWKFSFGPVGSDRPSLAPLRR